MSVVSLWIIGFFSRTLGIPKCAWGKTDNKDKPLLRCPQWAHFFFLNTRLKMSVGVMPTGSWPWFLTRVHYIPVHPTALLDLRQISPTQLPRLHWRLLLPLLDQFCVLGSVEERISSAYKRLDLLHQIHGENRTEDNLECARCFASSWKKYM